MAGLRDASAIVACDLTLRYYELINKSRMPNSQISKEEIELIEASYDKAMGAIYRGYRRNKNKVPEHKSEYP